VPPWRVVAGAWIAAAAVGGAYAIARETPIFAIRHITVEGVPPPLADAVRQAVSAYRGASLVSLDGSGVLGRVDALPTVSGARYDRAFPNTLRIVVTAERPVAVLRAGTGSWLVSTRARVLRTITRTVDRELPRIWIPAGTPVVVGATLSQDAGGAAARALAPLARSGFPARITAVTLADGELRFELAGGVELRLGRPDDLRLKLAVARRIVRLLPQGTTYLDVSVPQRPVSGGNTQVSG
jgi:cell division protein FtsQ